MKRLNPIRCSVAAAMVLALLAPAASAEAQYFGRNKVQYESFDFRVLQTPNFDIYYYPEAEDAARDAARMAERWYARLARVFDHRFAERQPVILYASHPHFQQTTAIDGSVSDVTQGVTEAFKQRVIMPFGHSAAETDHVLGHELVHAFQYDISGVGRAGAGIEAAARRFQVPLWFMEGMAEYLSLGPEHALTANWLRNAALAGRLPTIRQLGEDPRIFPYRYGHAVWAYIGGRWGDAVIGQLLKLAGEGVPYEQAFERVLNVSLDDLSEDWHAAVRRTYLPQLADLREARQDAQPLLTHRRGGGRLNLAPSLSPDGERVAFLSERGSGDIELLLADATTGEVIRRLQRGTAFDPHVGSLRYVQSAGSWSPDGGQFVFSALRGARDLLVVVDADRGRRVRTIEVAGASELAGPAWSPDGGTIVVSGMAGGRTDLFAVELASGQTRRLTADRYAALQPAFSPDGRTIAFVTDRHGADWDALTYGPYRVALLDLATGEVRRAPDAGGSHNINPQWSADGRSLYLVSDRSGIPDIYRVELDGGALHRVTNLFSGVSGIASLSPALSMARNGRRLLFTAFEEHGWNIYGLDGAARLAGVAIPDDEDLDARPGMALPPVPRPSEPAFNQVATLLADSTTGLPAPDSAAAFTTAPYRPRLGLDYLGQPQVGVSLSNSVFGRTGLYGGISGIFSDLLGGHTVGGVIQLDGRLDELGAALQYLNSQRRWNYGAGVHRVPYIYAYATQGSAAGAPRDQIVRVRQFDTGLTGYARYPFSQVRRLDLSLGVRRIALDAQVFDVAFHPVTGEGVVTGRQDVDGEAYNMVEASAAWVYDSALFGWTAPIAGQRARLEITPAVGQLRFTSALADARRYFYLNPFTLAVRGLHFGRYGRDGEGFFSDLYLGDPGLLRGYDAAYGYCRSWGVDCEVLNQLLGSRIAVASAELRAPLLRPRGGMVPPVDLHAFYDAGVAWTAATSPTFSTAATADPAQRPVLASAGVGLRTNLFGAFVLQIDRVRAFALEDDAWRWVFAIQPGF